MNSNLESFKPKLRPGRVIPQGSRIIFETDNPYNQIVLPMALADLILLCSGQFSVRQIVEKIYKKQGAVPFKSILITLHLLHQGGFFENGKDLVLSSYLNSWMEPSRNRWHVSVRLKQRLHSPWSSAMAYYLLTLGAIIAAFWGLQHFPTSILHSFETWLLGHSPVFVAGALVLAASFIKTLRHLLAAAQMLVATGKVFNISLRLSFWGLHLHVGDETGDLFGNRLYSSMFHISHMLSGWIAVFAATFFLEANALTPLVLAAVAHMFWQMNPFVSSDGRKLIHTLLLPAERDVVSWHFETSRLIKAVRSDSVRQDQEFARIHAIWGLIWLLMCVAVLQETALVFGPEALTAVSNAPQDSWMALLGLGTWLTSLYFVVQAFIEAALTSLIRPYLGNLKQSLRNFRKPPKREWKAGQVTAMIENLPLFSHLHEEFLHKLILQTQVLEFSEGAKIIREGEPARELYVLLDGEIEVVRSTSPGDAEWVSELGAISVFGETALVDEQPRSETVVARNRASVLRIPIFALRQTAQEAQSIRHLEDFRNAILVNQFFASSPVFRSLSTESIEFLQSRGTLEYFDRGQTVFHQGDLGDSLYLVLRGKVEVQIHGSTIKTISQGGFFGEIALIANIPRTATILTTEPCVLFKVSADAFWEVLVQHMDLGVFIESVSEARLKEDLELAPRLLKTGSES